MALQVSILFAASAPSHLPNSKHFRFLQMGHRVGKALREWPSFGMYLERRVDDLAVVWHGAVSKNAHKQKNEIARTMLCAITLGANHTVCGQVHPSVLLSQ